VTSAKYRMIVPGATVTSRESVNVAIRFGNITDFCGNSPAIKIDGRDKTSRENAKINTRKYRRFWWICITIIVNASDCYKQSEYLRKKEDLTFRAQYHGITKQDQKTPKKFSMVFGCNPFFVSQLSLVRALLVPPINSVRGVNAAVS
jgi:hypothetical protein